MGRPPYLAAVPIVLVGATVDGRPDFATVGDCTVLGLRPALLAISLAASHQATRGALAERVFSVSIPTVSMVALVDYLGTVSGRDIDTGVLLASTPGPETGAPLAEACPIGIECRVRSLVEIENRRIFIFRVVQPHVGEVFLAGPPGHPAVAPLTVIRPTLMLSTATATAWEAHCSLLRGRSLAWSSRRRALPGETRRRASRSLGSWSGEPGDNTAPDGARSRPRGPVFCDGTSLATLVSRPTTERGSRNSSNSS